MRQLPLDLTPPPRFGRDDFLRAGSNDAALDLIEAWPAWPDRIVLLCGPPGAGKSHLAAIWCEEAGATRLDAASFGRPDWPSAVGDAVLVDDADSMAVAELPLFHLCNLVRERGGSLLITAQAAPDRWGLHTPDLLSRLRVAPLVRLEEPDDALLRAVLVKLLADRQLVVDESVVAYAVLRLARSLEDARRFVDALDRASLAAGRPITRPLAAGVLQALDLDEPAR